MTSIFANEMKEEARKTTTENGAIAYSDTKNALVDLFGIIGAIRGKDVTRLHAHIDAAYRENPLLLAKMIFYARDIRGGLGERDTFREAIHYCAIHYPEIIKGNMYHIADFGRWDDIFALIDTPLEEDMFACVYSRLKADRSMLAEGGDRLKGISLLAKWLPTADASSERTRKFAKRVAKGLGFKTTMEYKKAYKPLRKYLNTVEAQMSANKWTEINYEHVPSRAMLLHKAAFYNHDSEGMNKYIESVNKGEKKINASALYPYDIVEKVMYTYNDDKTLSALWDALPNYIDGEKNFLIMADVSGSMTGRPMATSIGLALYFAQRNKGAYHGLFMTFTSNPKIVKVPEGRTLAGTIKAISDADWEGSTDLEKAFDKILDIALKSKCTQEDLPEALIIVTDMEFDAAIDRSGLPFMESMRDKFRRAGYNMPNIVFWNVNSRNDVYHESADKKGVVMVSGHSPSTFKNLMAGLNGKTAYDLMLEVLNDPRYDCIKLSKI